jgi:hypothetical protein
MPPKPNPTAELYDGIEALPHSDQLNMGVSTTPRPKKGELGDIILAR